MIACVSLSYCCFVRYKTGMFDHVHNNHISHCWAFLPETFEVKCNLCLASRSLATTLRLGIVLLRIQSELFIAASCLFQ